MSDICLTPDRLMRAKVTQVVRRAELGDAVKLLTTAPPMVGDLMLARVTSTGDAPHLELASGRLAHLFAGDEVVVCYGRRRDGDVRADVPHDLLPCQLVAPSGIAARVNEMRQGERYAELMPLGLLARADGSRMNLGDWALPAICGTSSRPVTFAVVGASAGSGKTTAAANLVRGLVLAGLRTAAAKVTGVAGGADPGYLEDAGAHPVLDFTWAGHPSTDLASADQVDHVLATLTGHLAQSDVDAIVLEVAGSIHDPEAVDLLSSAAFRARVDGIVLTAVDGASAAAASDWLQGHELPVIAVTGPLARTPRALGDGALFVDLVVLDAEALRQVTTATALCRSATLAPGAVAMAG